MSVYSTLQYQVSDRVARITLNRPEHANAITLDMPVELAQAVEAVPRSQEVVEHPVEEPVPRGLPSADAVLATLAEPQPGAPAEPAPTVLPTPRLFSQRRLDHNQPP